MRIFSVLDFCPKCDNMIRRTYYGTRCKHCKTYTIDKEKLARVVAIYKKTGQTPKMGSSNEPTRDQIELLDKLGYDDLQPQTSQEASSIIFKIIEDGKD